jgi:hypothetical protein
MVTRARLRHFAEDGREILIGAGISCGLCAVALGLGIVLLAPVAMMLALARGGEDVFRALAIAVLAIVGFATARIVGSRGKRALGALLFYPILLVGYLGYEALLSYQQSIASAADYSGRTIPNPVGRIAALVVNDPNGTCTDECLAALLGGFAETIYLASFLTFSDQRPLVKSPGSGLTIPRVVGTASVAEGPSCQGRDARLQREGIFGPCLIVEAAPSPTIALPEGAVVVLSGHDAQRPFGPTNSTVAAVMKGGALSEIARWENGKYPRSGKHAPGAPFTLTDFLCALTGLSGEGLATEAAKRSFRATIEVAHAYAATPGSALYLSPALNQIAKAYQREFGESARLDELDPDIAAKLVGIVRAACTVLPKQGCTGTLDHLVPRFSTPRLSAEIRRAALDPT